MKKNKLFYPSDYEMVKRTFPYYDYDKDAYKDAVSEVKKFRMVKKLKKMNQNNSLNKLNFVGPTNIGGRIVDLEFNPQNPNIVYAAAATGGVFKSVDAGFNWVPIFDDQPSLTIGDIGIDPNNPEILYVGTGEANGGHNNFPGLGLYRSSNGGDTWQFIGLDSTVSIARIVVDPSNSRRVFVAAVGSYFTPNPQRGIYLSEDGGTSWKKSLFISDSTGAIDLVIDHQNPNNIYAAMWERVRRPVLISTTHLYGPSGGIFRTTNGGKNWEKLDKTNGLPDPLVNNIGRIGLTISNSNPSILYAAFNDGISPYGIYKTTDGGNNWIETNNSFPGSSDFSWYFGQIRVDPLNPAVIYFLDVSLMKSSDSGLNWDFSYGYSGQPQLHVDHHALAFHPNNSNYILSGNDGGINISQDAGVTWSAPVKLPITQFYEIGLDKLNPQKYYGGTQDNGTIRTLSGAENDWQNIYNGDGFYVLVNPDNSNIIYAEAQFGDLGKSTDQGVTFTDARNGINLNEPTNWSTPVIFDPNNSNILYYGTHTLYRTEDAAGTWKAISPKLTNFSIETKIGTITTIAVAPTNSDIICVGTDDGHVWVSSDYGIRWRDVSQSLPYRWVTRVAFDPGNENVIYATFSGLRWADSEPRVFRSTNLGSDWTNISSNLPDAPVNAFAINNRNSDILYLGNDVGVFVSRNQGSSWDVLSTDLPIVVVNDLKIHTVANYLAIGTHGRGIYKFDLNELVKNNEKFLPEDFSLSQNYPNPFNPTTTIEYTIPPSAVISNERGGVINKYDSKLSSSGGNENTNVSLIVYDILGQQVKTLVNNQAIPGNYKLVFNASKLTSGIYYYSLKYNSTNITRKMIYLK